MKHILIVNTAQDKSNLSFSQSVNSLLRESLSDIVSFQDIKTTEDTKGYDGIIISGQPIEDCSYTPETVNKNYRWIKEVDLPIFGFCGGHQAIGMIYGADLIQDREAETKGFYAAYAENAFKTDPIFKDIDFGRCNSFIVYNTHRDSITEPKDFDTLASTDRCKVALMKHKHKLIYGSQFHPEDPDYYYRHHGINLGSNQDSNIMLLNFERML